MIKGKKLANILTAFFILLLFANLAGMTSRVLTTTIYAVLGAVVCSVIPIRLLQRRVNIWLFSALISFSSLAWLCVLHLISMYTGLAIITFRFDPYLFDPFYRPTDFIEYFLRIALWEIPVLAIALSFVNIKSEKSSLKQALIVFTMIIFIHFVRVGFLYYSYYFTFVFFNYPCGRSLLPLDQSSKLEKTLEVKGGTKFHVCIVNRSIWDSAMLVYWIEKESRSRIAVKMNWLPKFFPISPTPYNLTSIQTENGELSAVVLESQTNEMPVIIVYENKTGRTWDISSSDISSSKENEKNYDLFLKLQKSWHSSICLPFMP